MRDVRVDLTKGYLTLWDKSTMNVIIDIFSPNFLFNQCLLEKKFVVCGKCTLLYGNELNQHQIALTKTYNLHILKLRMACKRFMDRKVFKYIVILCFLTIFLYQCINGLLRYLEKNTSYHVVMTVSVIDNFPQII